MTSSTPIYKDPAQPLAARVDDLLARMTLEEKIAQMHAFWLILSESGEHRVRPGEAFVVASDADSVAIAVDFIGRPEPPDIHVAVGNFQSADRELDRPVDTKLVFLERVAEERPQRARIAHRARQLVQSRVVVLVYADKGGVNYCGHVGQ